MVLAPGRADPFRRNDALLNLLPKGVLAGPGSGIADNLVDRAARPGIPGAARSPFRSARFAATARPVFASRGGSAALALHRRSGGGALAFAVLRVGNRAHRVAVTGADADTDGCRRAGGHDPAAGDVDIQTRIELLDTAS